MKLLYSDGVNHFFQLEFDDWLLLNLQGKFQLGNVEANSQTVFAVACWKIWKTRNEFIFQQKVMDVMQNNCY